MGEDRLPGFSTAGLLHDAPSTCGHHQPHEQHRVKGPDRDVSGRFGTRVENQREGCHNPPRTPCPAGIPALLIDPESRNSCLFSLVFFFYFFFPFMWRPECRLCHPHLHSFTLLIMSGCCAILVDSFLSLCRRHRRRLRFEPPPYVAARDCWCIVVDAF